MLHADHKLREVTQRPGMQAKTYPDSYDACRRVLDLLDDFRIVPTSEAHGANRDARQTAAREAGHGVLPHMIPSPMEPASQPGL